MRSLDRSLGLALVIAGWVPACQQSDLMLGQCLQLDASEGHETSADAPAFEPPDRDGGAEAKRTESGTANPGDGKDSGTALLDGASTEATLATDARKEEIEGDGGTDSDRGEGDTDAGGEIRKDAGGGEIRTDAGGGEGGTPPGGCGEVPSGSREERIRFAYAQATPTAGCESEAQTRTCTNGAFSGWTGSFTEERCVTLEPCNVGDERIKAGACGYNRRGRLTQRCVDGRWTDTDHCLDPDDCLDGRSESEACGVDDLGTRQVLCSQGRRVPGLCSAVSLVQISAGIEHSCALLDTGRLQCWGRNADKRNSPAGATFVQAVTGETWGCGLTADGTLNCWGYLSTVAPAPTNIRFKKIGQSGDCGHGLDVDGRVRIWNCAEQSALKPGQYVDYTAGDGWYCGVDADGHAKCVAEYNVPGVTTGDFPADAGRYLEAAAGCALREDGIILCLDDSHQLPMNRYRHLIPVQGLYYPGPVTLCAVTRAGTLECEANAKFRAGLPKGGHVRDFVAGEHHTCTLRDTGDMECAGLFPDFSKGLPTGGGFATIAAGGGTLCWQRADRTVGCVGEIASSPVTEPAIKFAVGRAAACQLDATGSLLCWGSMTDLRVPTAYANAHFSEIGVGDTYVAGILSDTADAGKILMWAPGAARDSSFSLVDAQAPYRQLAMGGDGYCAEGNDGLTRCYTEGYPLHEALYDGKVSMASVTSGAIACALDASGLPKCQGVTPTSETTPLKKIVVNNRLPDHYTEYPDLCVIQFTGIVSCSPDSPSARSRITMNSLRLDDLVMGDGFACGIATQDGSIGCWGFYDFGQSRIPFPY